MTAKDTRKFCCMVYGWQNPLLQVEQVLCQVATYITYMYIQHKQDISGHHKTKHTRAMNDSDDK